MVADRTRELTADSLNGMIHYFLTKAREIIEDLTFKVKGSWEMVEKIEKEKTEKTENYLAIEKVETSVKRLEKEVKNLNKMNAILVGRENFYWFFFNLLIDVCFSVCCLMDVSLEVMRMKAVSLGDNLVMDVKMNFNE